MKKFEITPAQSFIILVAVFLLLGVGVKTCEEPYRKPDMPKTNDVVEALKEYNACQACGHKMPEPEPEIVVEFRV